MNKNTEYWEKRSLELMKNIYNKQEKNNKKILEVYDKALKDIKSEIATLYEKLGDNISLSEAYKYNRLLKIQAQIEARIKELTKEEVKVDREILRDSYVEAYKKVCANLGIEFNNLKKEAVEKAINYPWSGHMFSQIIWKNANKLVYNINNIITRGLINGTSYVNMAKELNKEMQEGKYNSLRVIRTETAHIVNQTTLDRYKNSNLMEKVKVITAEDGTCEECGSMNLQEFTIGSEPMLPFHAQCRCCYAPVIEVE